MVKEFKDIIKDEIFSFLQYRSKGDEEAIDSKLESIKEIDGKLYIGEVGFNVDTSDDNAVIGVALANIPLIFVGLKHKAELPYEKLAKIYNAAEKLISLKDSTLNDIATLQIYLLMEMGLRELYSKQISDQATIEYKGKSIALRDMDYRKLKLYVRMKHMSLYDIRVNGKAFPYSQGSLLNWAEGYMNDDYAEAFKISLNVRNLLAHGELEWDLNPSIASLYTASYMVNSLFDNVTPPHP